MAHLSPSADVADTFKYIQFRGNEQTQNPNSKSDFYNFDINPSISSNSKTKELQIESNYHPKLQIHRLNSFSPISKKKKKRTYDQKHLSKGKRHFGIKII